MHPNKRLSTNLVLNNEDLIADGGDLLWRLEKVREVVKSKGIRTRDLGPPGQLNRLETSHPNSPFVVLLRSQTS